jgi:hypothetical protein
MEECTAEELQNKKQESIVQMANLLASDQVVTEVAKNFYGMVMFIKEVLPDSREKSIAITKLEEADMWAQRSLQARLHEQMVAASQAKENEEAGKEAN